jgi:hypothetical protein
MRVRWRHGFNQRRGSVSRAKITDEDRIVYGQYDFVIVSRTTSDEESPNDGYDEGFHILRRTLCSCTNEWVCQLGWDDRQNGQSFADRPRAAWSR